MTSATAIGVAGYVAFTLAYVAQNDFGFSSAQIRSAAIIAAFLVAMLMAIDFLGRKLAKAGRRR